MADRPIIFSAPMVQALLAGRKSQTRRVLKPQPNDRNTGGAALTDQGWAWLNGWDGSIIGRASVPYAPGDRLYVREAACWVSGWGWRYRADNDDLTEKREAGEGGRWRPSIHMPRWASRLTLTVTDVRVQRLQDISEADAIAEGIQRLIGSKGPNYFTREISGKWSGSFNAPTAAEVYSDLWNSLHGPDAWDANPWVVALTFTVQCGNIDQIGGANG